MFKQARHQQTDGQHGPEVQAAVLHRRQFENGSLKLRVKQGRARGQGLPERLLWLLGLTTDINDSKEAQVIV